MSAFTARISERVMRGESSFTGIVYWWGRAVFETRRSAEIHCQLDVLEWAQAHGKAGELDWKYSYANNDASTN